MIEVCYQFPVQALRQKIDYNIFYENIFKLTIQTHSSYLEGPFFKGL